MTSEWKNRLYFGDNLDMLRAHVETESVDLIYLGHPSNSDCRSRAFVFLAALLNAPFSSTLGCCAWDVPDSRSVVYRQNVYPEEMKAREEQTAL